MALILNIDTSSPVCSVCLAYDGTVIAEENDLSGHKHASLLTTYISDILHRTGSSSGDLSAIAISSGPGSYTGLRIGTSVAKGMCFALNIPLIAISTLHGMANRVAAIYPDKTGIYIPMLDARRDDVYLAMYDGDNRIIKNDTFLTVDEKFSDIFASHYEKNIYFCGSGSVKAQRIIKKEKRFFFAGDIKCIASNISGLSYQRYVAGSYEDLSYFEPFYLKEFEGQRKIK